MVTLDEAKQYLRIDNDEEDILLSSLIVTATELVEGVVRCKISEFDTIPETVRLAGLFIVATLYEQRQGGKEGLDMQDMLDVVKRMTFAHRKELW